MENTRNKPSFPRFNLDGTTNSKEAQRINMIFRYTKDENGKHVKLKYYTGKKTYRKNWDSNTQRVKHGLHVSTEVAIEINKVLGRLEELAMKIAHENRDIKTEDFKNRLDIEMGRVSKPLSKEETPFLDYVKKYIQLCNKDPRTIQKHRSTYTHLQAFENHFGTTLTFDCITSDFAKQFIQFLYGHTNVQSDNTVNKILGDIKVFMRESQENGYHSNTSYLSRRFGVSRIRTSKHHLSSEELGQLLNLDLKNYDTLQKVKDFWLIAAFTGLRYSDVTNLEPKHFKERKGEKFIQIDQYKGRKSMGDRTVTIPVLKTLEKILSMYDYSAPVPFKTKKNENIMLNRKIKEICQMAGLNRRVETRKSVKGNLETVINFLHEKVTIHTARYTYINIMLNEKNVSPFKLGKITGQSLDVLMGYESGSPIDNAFDILEYIEDDIL